MPLKGTLLSSKMTNLTVCYDMQRLILIKSQKTRQQLPTKRHGCLTQTIWYTLYLYVLLQIITSNTNKFINVTPMRVKEGINVKNSYYRKLFKCIGWSGSHIFQPWHIEKTELE